jgi:hypothetical protein
MTRTKPSTAVFYRTLADRDRHDREEQLRVLNRRELVAEMQLNGISISNMAKVLNVSRATIYKDLEAVTADRLLETGVTTLKERLVLSVSRRLAHHAALVMIANDRKSPAQARVMALTTANAILNDIDRLEGTVAAESVNSAVLAEVLDTVLGALQEADPAIQRRVLEALSDRAPANSSIGLLITSAVATSDSNEGNDSNEGAGDPEREVIDADAGPVVDVVADSDDDVLDDPEGNERTR